MPRECDPICLFFGTMKIKGLYEKRGWWYYQPPQVNGIRPKRVALRTKSRAEALRLYEVLAKQDFRDRRGGQLRAEIDRYLAEKLSRGIHTEKTSRNTGYTLGQLADFLGPGKAVGEIRTADMQEWVGALGKTNNSTSINSVVGSTKGFFSWAVKEGLLLESPIAGLELPKKVVTRSESYCSREERDRLIARVDRDDLALILHLGFFAGMRIGEIVEARRDWLDLDGRVITIRNTSTFTAKGKRTRKIRMSHRLHGFMVGYLERWADLAGVGSGLNDYLLRPDKADGKKWKKAGSQPNRWRYDPTRPFKDHARACGLEWIGFHSMRHTFGTLHAMANTPLATIAREMGDDYKTTFNSYVGYTRHGDHSDAID